MAYLLGIWGCFALFAATGLGRLFVVRRLRRELDAQTCESAGAEMMGKTSFPDLIKQHKLRFPASKTRYLTNVLVAAQVLAAGAALVLIVAAQFQPHSLFHLIPSAR